MTVGLRHFQHEEKQASMSVFTPDVEVECSEGFRRICPEKDVCCIGNYPFKLNNWYRYIIYAGGSFVEGYIYSYETQELIKLARFLTGENSLLQASTRNSVSLERVGLLNPCEEKTRILCRNLLRKDITGLVTSASHVQAKYEDCVNSNIEKNEEGNIVISHGGNTERGDILHNGWIEINYNNLELIELL